MAKRDHCALCNAVLPPHGFYIVRTDVYAEPSVPPVSAEDLQEMDPETTIAELMGLMKQMDADELQDQVHRRFEHKICATCQKEFLANPLGKPRRSRTGKN